MALKVFLIVAALAAVIVGFALPTPQTTAEPHQEPQIATLDLG